MEFKITFFDKRQTPDCHCQFQYEMNGQKLSEIVITDELGVQLVNNYM